VLTLFVASGLEIHFWFDEKPTFEDTVWALSGYATITLGLLFLKPSLHRIVSRIQNTAQITVVEKLTATLLVVSVLWLLIHLRIIGPAVKSFEYPKLFEGPFVNAAANIIIWLMIVLLFILAELPSTRVRRREDSIDGFPLEDLPLDPEVDKDELGIAGFASTVSRLLLSGRQRSAIVFGLLGDWGVGKSSVINLIERDLKNTPKLRIIKYSPWYTDSQETMLSSFFSLIAESITQHQIYPKVSKEFQKYQQLLVRGLSAKWLNVSSLLTEPSVESQKKLLNEVIEKSGYRFLVFIDDVDRLDEEEIRFVFKLVRLCADFSAFRYLLAFDKNRVGSVFRALGGEQYISKIVQVEIPVPKPERIILDVYFADHLNKLTAILGIKPTESDVEEFRVVYQRGMKDLLTTVREIKRLLNSVYFNITPIKNEVNFNDFIAIEMVRLYFNEAYDEIYRKREYFYQAGWSPSAGQDLLFLELQDDGQHNEYLKSFFILYGKDRATILSSLLSSMFRKVANFNRVTSVRYEDHDGASASALRERRIEHPDYFEQYFLFKVPRRQVPEESINAFLHFLADGNPEAISLKTLELARFYQDKGLLVEFFDKLIIRSGEITATKDEWLIWAICEHSEIFSHDLRVYLDSESDRARALVFAISNKYSNAPRVQLILESAVRQSRSIAFAASIIHWLQPEHNKIIEKWEHIRQEVLREILKARFVEEFVEPDEDLIKEEGRSFKRVLDEIKDPGLTTQYIYRLLKEQPRHAGAFLDIYVTVTRGATHEEWQFDYNRLKSEFEPSKIFPLISQELGPNPEQAEDALYESDAERNMGRIKLRNITVEKRGLWAVAQFVKNYRRP